MPDPTAIPAEFQRVFDLQAAAHRRTMNPSYEARKADLLSLHRLVAENGVALVAAVNADYGCRSRFETRFAKLFMAQEAAHDAARQLRKFIKPRGRHLAFAQYPLAKAWTFRNRSV